jgi:hypothetical protein
MGAGNLKSSKPAQRGGGDDDGGQDYNGITPVEPVQVEKQQIGAPPGAYDGPERRAEWWALVPVSKRRGALPGYPGLRRSCRRRKLRNCSGRDYPRSAPDLTGVARK